MKTTSIKRIIAIAMASAMLLLCAACAGDTQSGSDYTIQESTGGKDITRTAGADEVFSLNSNSKYSLNPLIATNHSNQLVCSLVYENMVELDNNFEVIPNVISEWSCSEDGTYWKFTVDTSHTFHDGTQVAGRDLRYSLERAINADRFKGRFASVQGVSYGENFFEVTLGIGDAQFIKLLNIPLIKNGTYGDPRPIGSGPYTYNEEGTELHAYEGYPGYDTLPLETIYIKEYQSAEDIISAFEDSLIDVVINDPSSYTNLGYASTNEIHTFATTNLHYVAFNEKSPIGQQTYFRLAMQFAFDRSNLVSLLNGNAVASALPMYPTCADYPTDLANNMRYSLEAVQAILENAGIRDYDEDGMLEYMSGSAQDFEIKFVLSSDSSAKAGVVRKFAEDMGSIGIKVNVHELSWEDYIKTLEEGEYDMYYGEIKLRNNFDLTELLQVRTKDNEGTNLNYTNSTDTAVETLINNYLKAGDATRATEAYVLYDHICNKSGAMITIGFEKQQIITRRGVAKGIDANIGNPLYNFQNWIIELDEE